MRDLGQPKVLQMAVLAALGSALASCPRLILWPAARYPLWYYETLMFLGGTVLWAFVFAWSEKYSQRPVFAWRVPWWEFLLVTALGTVVAAVEHLRVDPVLRTRIPEDFPASTQQWAAMVLFSLAFTTLFLVFAPFAWLVRLFRKVRVAAVLTVVFGLFVFWMKNENATSQLEPHLLRYLFVSRLISGAISVWLYLRGGALLVWWWQLLVQSRLLLG